jgi:ribosomal protein L32
MRRTSYATNWARQQAQDQTCEHCGQVPEQHHSDTRCYTVEEIGHRLRFSQRRGRWPGPDEGCEEEEPDVQ